MPISPTFYFFTFKSPFLQIKKRVCSIRICNYEWNTPSIFIFKNRACLSEVYISFFSLLANLCVAVHELIYATCSIDKLALTSIERVRCA